ncbi:MAG: methionyl-tRNA formyltransferase, partial [Halioglobus sp.]|nr:methionyl-tRNA formyltransferase [Halioglobus sp.]
VHCGAGQLLVESLQLPGGKVLRAAQVLAARADQFAVGNRFEPALHE